MTWISRLRKEARMHMCAAEQKHVRHKTNLFLKSSEREVFQIFIYNYLLT